MHLDTDTAQVVDLMTAARAPLFTYAQDITPLNAGDAAGSCDDAAERLAAACADPTGSPDRSLPRDRGSEIGDWCKYVEGPAAECNPSIQRLEPALAAAVKVVGVTAAVPLNSVELACTRAREMNTVCAAAQLSPAVLGSSIARSLLGKVGELRPVMLPLAAVGAAVATALSSTRVGRSTKSNNFKTI